MANTNLQDKYFVKRSESATWEDFTTKFIGCKILMVDGFNERGDSVNVYNAQWVNSQSEDFLVTTKDSQSNDVIIRKNVDLSLTFIVSRRYADRLIDEESVYNDICAYFDGGAFYIKSAYTGMEAYVACMKSFKPTTEKLHRGDKSYIMATATLHTLDAPEVSPIVPPTGTQEIYIGFGNATISSMSDITSLTNVQHYVVDDVQGDYTITTPSTKYLWICSTMEIENVVAYGFEVPLRDSATTIGDFKCYRSGNAIIASTMDFTINT